MQSAPSALDRDAETNKRSTFNIVWSCIITTFLCAWVSVHPDVPRYESGGSWLEKSYKQFSRRLLLLFWAVIAPEVIVGWATMEYFAASKIEREYKKNGSRRICCSDQRLLK
jgi:hypothetical protein